MLTVTNRRSENWLGIRRFCGWVYEMPCSNRGWRSDCCDVWV